MTLTCKATVTFEVDNIQIGWDGPRNFKGYNITESNSNLTHISLLYIQNLEEADGGEYTCTFTAFEVGTFMNGSIFVEVEGKEGSVSDVYSY